LSAVSHRAVGWRGVATLAAVITLAAGLGQTTAGHTLLRKAGLFEEPASYTTLAFLSPQDLPRSLNTGRQTVGVSFVIGNTGSASRHYQWSMRLVQGPRTTRVAAGSVSLTSGREATVTRSAKIFCTRGQARLVVSLANPAEHIDFLTACSSHRS
jgi:hypothetical protein